MRSEGQLGDEKEQLPAVNVDGKPDEDNCAIQDLKIQGQHNPSKDVVGAADDDGVEQRKNESDGDAEVGWRLAAVTDDGNHDPEG